MNAFKDLGDENKHQEMTIAFFRASKVKLKFPFNMILYPYHYVLSLIFILACLYEYIPLPWYYGLAPTVFSLIVNAFLMASFSSLIEFGREEALRKKQQVKE